MSKYGCQSNANSYPTHNLTERSKSNSQHWIALTNTPGCQCQFSLSKNKNFLYTFQNKEVWGNFPNSVSTRSNFSIHRILVTTSTAPPHPSIFSSPLVTPKFPSGLKMALGGGIRSSARVSQTGLGFTYRRCPTSACVMSSGTISE